MKVSTMFPYDPFDPIKEPKAVYAELCKGWVVFKNGKKRETRFRIELNDEGLITVVPLEWKLKRRKDVAFYVKSGDLKRITAKNK